MLTVVPLVILVAISTLWRRMQGWVWLTGLVCFAFVMALFFNPPYGFSPEDNLAYRDYVLMHEEAAELSRTEISASPGADGVARDG